MSVRSTTLSPGLVTMLLLVAACVVPEYGHAASTAKAPPIVWPDSPCDLAHRMDVAIVDGMFFECQCMRLLVGYQCDWYLVAGVSSAKLSRRIKRPVMRVMVHAARPAVVA